MRLLPTPTSLKCPGGGVYIALQLNRVVDPMATKIQPSDGLTGHKGQFNRSAQPVCPVWKLAIAPFTIAATAVV